MLYNVSINWGLFNLSFCLRFPVRANLILFSFRIGPMTTEIKHRKPVVQRKRVRPTGNERPEEVSVFC